VKLRAATPDEKYDDHDGLANLSSIKKMQKFKQKINREKKKICQIIRGEKRNTKRHYRGGHACREKTHQLIYTPPCRISLPPLFFSLSLFVAQV
jgi:hypothetical protein